MVSKVDLSMMAPGVYWAKLGEPITLHSGEKQGVILATVDDSEHVRFTDSEGDIWFGRTVERAWPVEFPTEPPALRVRDLAVGSVFRKDGGFVGVKTSRGFRYINGFTSNSVDESTFTDEAFGHETISELLFDGATITKGGE